MTKLHQVAGKKRWGKVGKEKRSSEMKKVRGVFDSSKIKLKLSPSQLKEDTLTEISNETQKGMDYAVLLALSDGKSRTEKEIKALIQDMVIVSSIELLRRKGLFEVSENFNWFTKWTVRQKAMVCPKCDYEWRLSKEDSKGICPNCGIDLFKLAVAMFPDLKKEKKD